MTKNVLIADDTKNIRTLLTTCLKLEGYEVDTAEDGSQAFQMLITNKYDLAFIDIKMPEMTGTELLRRAKQNEVKTQIIMMTAFATVKNAIDCTKLGAVLYIQKPFSANKVRTILSELNSVQTSRINNEEEINRNNRDVSKDDQINELLSKAKQEFVTSQDNPEIYATLGKIFEKRNETVKASIFYKFAEELENFNK